MPHFVNLYNLVPPLHGQVQFQTHPRPGEDALFVRVMTRGCLLSLLDAGATQSKHQFVVTLEGEHGMMEASGCQHVALNQSKIAGHVRVNVLLENGGVPHRVHTVLVDVRLKTGKIHVLDFCSDSFCLY